MSIKSSNYHIEINLLDSKNHDRIIAQDLIKNVANNYNFDKQKFPFKIIILNKSDNISLDAQNALRRTMELYSDSCKLIFVATNIGNIIGPILSRGVLIKIPSPNEVEIKSILKDILYKERRLIQDTVIDKLISINGRNLYTNILSLETLCYKKNINDKMDIREDWLIYNDQLCEEILNNSGVKNIINIRKKVYVLLTCCIPPKTILKTLGLKLINMVDEKFKRIIIRELAKADFSLTNSTKAILHLESFIISVLYELEKTKSNNIIFTIYFFVNYIYIRNYGRITYGYFSCSLVVVFMF